MNKVKSCCKSLNNKQNEKNNKVQKIAPYILLIILTFICLQCYAQNCPSLKLNYKIKNLPNFIEQRQYDRTGVTVLNKDNILFLGGLKNNESLKSTEIYNIKTNKFIKTADMNNARSSPLALLLHDGNVLIIGGIKYPEKKEVTDVELLDIKNNKFYTIAQKPEKLRFPIYIYQAESSNKIVCFSSAHAYAIWYFDLAKKTFIKSKNYGWWKIGSGYGPHVFVKDKIYFFPYSVEKRQSLPIYELNINTDTLKKIETDLLLGLNSRDYDSIPVNVNDLKIMFFGSFSFGRDYDLADIIEYNIETQKAQIISNLTISREIAKAIKINKNKVLIYGGTHGSFEDMKSVKYTESFDINKNTSQKIQNLKLKENCRYKYIAENEILSFCGNKASILNFKK